MVGHMPKIRARSFWWMPLDCRKEMTSLREWREAVRRVGLRARARPESTPIISRQRIFSLNWRERLFMAMVDFGRKTLLVMDEFGLAEMGELGRGGMEDRRAAAADGILGSYSEESGEEEEEE